MYCPKCGKAQQEPESYCRSCGEFLMDYSGRSYFLTKLLGGSNPSAQIGIGLAINLITIFTSILLLGFLNGHYDAQKARTGEGVPPVIYLVYLFLIVISLWQILSLVVGARLRTKLNRKKGLSERAEMPQGVVSSKKTNELLPYGDSNQTIPLSVTEGPTKILNKLKR